MIQMRSSCASRYVNPCRRSASANFGVYDGGGRSSSARFTAKLEYTKLDAPHSCSMVFEGQGGPAGFGKGEAQLVLTPEGGVTVLSYHINAQIGGKLAQIGSRLVDATARKMADDFFAKFNDVVVASRPAIPAPAEAVGGIGAGPAALWKSRLIWIAAALLAGGLLYYWVIPPAMGRSDFGRGGMADFVDSQQRLPVNPEWSCAYDRSPEYDSFIAERDVRVRMRDGVELCVDIYRPHTDRKLPALLAFAIYNKDIQGPDVSESFPSQPAWAPLWTGCLEAGDTRFFTSRGYIHVIGSPRNIAKSGSGGDRNWDSYDLIEWIAHQPWCDGNVGMTGISGFAAEQWHAAKQRPPSLKVIFPFDPRGAYGKLGGFRDEYPGGVLPFLSLSDHALRRSAPGKGLARSATR